ncbi:MAG: metallophosphoesterase family protein [Deltaproteobacteria bacterium]|nr:metallophosphoesterase family protein [Deltaproteobacteria bacterium]
MLKNIFSVLFLTVFPVLTVLSCSRSDSNNSIAECNDENKYIVPQGTADETFLVGPYLMHTTGSFVALSWETKAQADTVVEYGLKSTDEFRVTGPSGTMHRAVMTRLEPGNVYKYKACSDQKCTGELTFATPPLLDTPFRFVVYGDSRSNPDEHAIVAKEIAESSPALVFNVGDIVERGEFRDQFKSMHFDPTRELGQHVPIYVSIGNHEFNGDRKGTYFKEYMMYPGDENLPDRPSEKDLPPHPEFSYAFRYQDVFFLILDDTMDALDIFSPVKGYEPPLWLWLKRQVQSEAAKTAKWRFAFMHYPPDSKCISDTDANSAPFSAVRGDVVPLLRENNFDALFTGHVHDYERMNFKGFPVVITGGGGAGLEQADSCTREFSQSQSFTSVHHYTVVDLNCEQADIRALDVDGNLLDEFTLKGHDGHVR